MSAERQLKIAVILLAYDRMSKKVDEAVNKAQAKLKSFASKADAVGDKAFKTGRTMIATGLAVGAPIYKAIEAAQDFETKMIDIRKQMQVDTPVTVAKMTNQVMDLSKRLPIATSDIQEMIASGLRMGVAEDKVIGFTESVTKMSVAFDMQAGEISDSMGKIANVFKIPIEKIGDFADAINYLDDNTMAKGPELIDVLQRIGGSAKNLDPKKAAALASAMLSLGESPETAGTAISAMINRLSSATMQSKKFQGGMDMLGLSAAKVQKLMSDPSTAQGAILDVFEKIQKLKPEKQTEALVRLFGTDAGPKLMKLTNNLEEYKRQMKLVNGAEKGSMDKEYQKRLKSTAAQWQIFKNKITEVAVKAGTTLLPAFIKIFTWVGKMIEKVSAFIEKHPVLVSWLGKLAACFAAINLVGGGVAFMVGGVAKSFGYVSKAASFVTGAIGGISKAFQFMRLVVMMNPIVAIVAGIAIVAVLVIANWGKVKEFFVRLWEGIKKIFTSVWKWIKKIFWDYSPAVLIYNNWGKIKQWFSDLWDKVKKKCSEIWEAIKEIVVAPIVYVKKKWDDLCNWFEKMWKKIKGWAKDAWSSITATVDSPIKSMIEKTKKDLPELQRQIAKGMAGVDDYLPHSPAKKGALSRLNKVRIIETIAETMRPNMLADKMNKITQGIAGAGMKGRTFSGGNRSNMQFNLNINLSGSATASDAEKVGSEVKKQISAMMKQYDNQRARVNF